MKRKILDWINSLYKYAGLKPEGIEESEDYLKSKIDTPMCW
ncbi:MAG: hypothetical protein ABJZ92_20025 [Cyclobacteriaceae bacterium]